MRIDLSELDGEQYDVAVIGAGANGAAAAKSLAAAGYRTLLVDKGDFASGSTSRSSKMISCGVHYLQPVSSVSKFLGNPKKSAAALRMARRAMQARADLVRTLPERVQPIDYFMPIYKSAPYKPWQVSTAFHMLSLLGGPGVPLDYQRLRPAEALRNPLLRHLRTPDELAGVAAYRDYLMEWPERIIVDTVLDAEALGATVRNYTAVTRIRQQTDEQWQLELTDASGGNSQARITAGFVLNLAGIWIDAVNESTNLSIGRKVAISKGVHVMVQLPPDCAGLGISTLNRQGEGFTVIPTRGMHSLGPTWTMHDGDPDDIRPLEEDIAWILEETNYLLPGLALKRSDVLFTWAGARPLTYDPAFPGGRKSREIRDLGAEGAGNMLAMTGGPVMTYRSAGEELAALIRTRRAPSGPPRQQRSLPRLPARSQTHVADAAQGEHVVTLADLLFRRLGWGWSKTMGVEQARQAANDIAPILGWDRQRIDQEVQTYLDYLGEHHSYSATAPKPF